MNKGASLGVGRKLAGSSVLEAFDDGLAEEREAYRREGDIEMETVQGVKHHRLSA